MSFGRKWRAWNGKWTNAIDNATGVEPETVLVHALKVLSTAANRAALFACVGCVLAMLTISFTGFFYMMITGEALSWTYSLARLFIPWIAMLSITVAFHAGEHVAMGMITGLLPPAFAAGLRLLVLLGIALFALLLLWFGWRFFIDTTRYYMVSDQLQVHARWVAACLPVSGALLLIHLVRGAALLEATERAGMAD